MNILIVNSKRVPTLLYGGIERVIWYLGKELDRLGHKVTFLTLTKSATDFADALVIDQSRPLIEQIPDCIDIVHFNFTPPNVEQLNKPYVITIHGNISEQIELNRNSIFISKNHADRYGADCFVYNGLDWDDYATPSFTCSRDYYHFLGKAAWRVKNVKGAIKTVAETESDKIAILGGDRLNFKMGFRFTLSRRAKFYSMVGGEKKFNLLNRSKGLIFPVVWHEPFGLAIIESLYYGAPVFGTPYGSLPEIVTEEVGFLSNRRDKLTEALGSSDQYSKKRCSDYVIDKFNSKSMALSYVECYNKVISGYHLNGETPKLKEKQKNRFLEWIK